MKVFFLSMIFSSMSAFAGNLDQYPTYEQANFYHSHSSQQKDFALEALEGYSFNPYASVLEIGSGSGRLAANIAGRLPKGAVLGLDYSEGMTEFASKNHNKKLYPNLSFLCEDFLQTDYDEDFTDIISFSTLHWISDHEILLKRVYDSLEPCGKVLFTIPAKPLPEVSAIFSSVINHERWVEYTTNYSHPRKKYTAEEYEGLLKKAGFTDYSVEQVKERHYFLNKREIMDWYASFTPLLAYIPEGLHEAFLEDIANRYVLTFPPNENGLILFIQNELHIKAMK